MELNLMDRVRRFWDQTPCGTRGLGEKEGTPEFFDRLEKDRDGREPFIPDFARFSRWKGKKVLEVGIGAGTDFIRFARAGADLFGVDLTQHAVDLAGRRLALEGLSAHIRQCNAEHLSFEDESFDLVYSWGVIHHTEDPRQAANEIVRVTKRGGRVCAMIYHRYSLVALQCWMLNALFKGKPWRTFSDVIRHHIESDGTKAYSIREAKDLFGGLADLIVTPVVTPYDVRLTRSTFLPRPVQSLIPKRFGWFLVVQGTKRA